MRRGGATCWRCVARDSKCPAKLRCDSTVKTVIEQTRRHNHPQSFDYNAADGSHQATVEENIAERRKDQYLFSAAETAPNVTISSTNSESGPRCSTEGMPRLAPTIGYPSCQGDRMWPKQFHLFGTNMYSSETTGNTSNASLIPETSNNGSVSSFCSTEPPIIQTNRSEIVPAQLPFLGAVETKAIRNMALEQSPQPASLIPETSNSGSVSSFSSTELPVIQRNHSEIAPAQLQFSGAVETKATRNMALEQSQQPGTSSSSFQGHSADDVQIIGVITAGDVSEISFMRNQFRKAISSRHQAQANVPVGHPALKFEFPCGVSYSYMGSFLCVECHKGETMCNRCPKNTMCRTCCKHYFFINQ
ncbi:hypothetical protein Ddc_17327 [Ditylenchus destructor]|nr:hypothetical protein Ddc_17327 [Ditylenchus destructor]